MRHRTTAVVMSVIAVPVVCLIAFEIFMAIWVTFGYPPANRRHWEYAALAGLWVMPVALATGLIGLLLRPRNYRGLAVTFINLAIVAAFVLDCLSDDRKLAFTWSGILGLEAFALLALRHLGTSRFRRLSEGSTT